MSRESLVFSVMSYPANPYKEVSSERSKFGFDCTRSRVGCIRADNAPTDNCGARTKRRSTAAEP